MLFIMIMMAFSLIGIVSFWGDYEEKEKQQDYKKYWEVINGGNNK